MMLEMAHVLVGDRWTMTLGLAAEESSLRISRH